MRSSLSRRQWLLGTSAALLSACAPRRAAVAGASDDLAALEHKLGGRLGVFALDTSSGRWLGHRADERFAMCSTFKWVLAAAVLWRAERQQLALEESLTYGAADLLEYAPVTRARVNEGAMRIDELTEAAVVLSDNTAANLLLGRIGGPAAITHFAREAGDAITRLDRREPELNEYVPGDPRDTTSPKAMVGLMQQVLHGDTLSTESRRRLLDWLRACETGTQRIRAGLPADWTAGDKTGTGARGTHNDVAVIWPPGRAPIFLAVYTSGCDAEGAVIDRAHAEIGGMVARAWS